MFKILSYVRYSDASLVVDKQLILGSIIFFLICGVLIFQNRIWDEEEFSKNKKWLNWKESAIKSNKGDLTRIYPRSKN